MPTCTYHDKRHVGHLDVCVGVLPTCMCLSCRRVHKCHVDVDTGVTLYSDTNLLPTCVRACVSACVRACVRACVCECVCVCVCVCV